jgi:hypothetical protein
MTSEDGSHPSMWLTADPPEHKRSSSGTFGFISKQAQRHQRMGWGMALTCVTSPHLLPTYLPPFSCADHHYPCAYRDHLIHC